MSASHVSSINRKIHVHVYLESHPWEFPFCVFNNVIMVVDSNMQVMKAPLDSWCQIRIDEKLSTKWCNLTELISSTEVSAFVVRSDLVFLEGDDGTNYRHSSNIIKVFYYLQHSFVVTIKPESYLVVTNTIRDSEQHDIRKRELDKVVSNVIASCSQSLKLMLDFVKHWTI